MKIFFFLVFWLSLQLVSAQPDTIKHYLSIKDSAVTVFGHDAIRCSSTLIPYDNKGNDLYMLYFNLRGTGLEIKFPQRDWQPYGPLTNDMFVYIIFQDVPFTQYWDLGILYGQDSTLFEEMKNGGRVYLRYCYNMSYDSTKTFQKVYSNVDSIWIPPANDHDRAAMAFLYQKGIAAEYLSRTLPNSTLIGDTLAAQFPQSLLGELAMLAANTRGIYDKYLANKITKQQRDLLVRSIMQEFVNKKKSDKIENEYFYFK